MPSKITRNFMVDVKAEFIPTESRPHENHYFFAYRILIKNEGETPAQLLARHWVITDGWGRIQEVRGPGVVGQQPNIEPQSVFEYTSFCPLNTPTGNMKGSYQMVAANGETFDIEIPLFILAEPESLN